jgi:hypothetical protein
MSLPYPYSSCPGERKPSCATHALTCSPLSVISDFAYPPFERFFTAELTEIFLQVHQQDLTAYQLLSKEPRCRHAVAGRIADAA